MKKFICFFLSMIFSLCFIQSAFAYETETETETQNSESESFSSEETTKEEAPAEEETTQEADSDLQGDANADGILSAEDARAVLRHAVAIEMLSEKAAARCDMDKDGAIKSADARLILRFSVGLPANSPKKELTKEDYYRIYSSSVSKDKLAENMDFFAGSTANRVVGSKLADKACEYITGKLREYGYEPYIQDNSYKNVIAVYPQRKQKESGKNILIFSAHYDSVGTTPGAVDNASGVCSVLELARLVKRFKPNSTYEIRFIFFTGEEKGYLGAYHYLKYLPQSERNRIECVCNFDMTAKPLDSKNYYLCISTEPVLSTYPYKTAAKNIGSMAFDKAKAFLGTLGETAYLSPVSAGMHDIVPFRKAGIPALTLSWREKNAANSHGSDQNLAAPSVIHTKWDTASALDRNSLFSATKLMAAAFAELCY